MSDLGGATISSRAIELVTDALSVGQKLAPNGGFAVAHLLLETHFNLEKMRQLTGDDEYDLGEGDGKEE